MHGNNTWRVRLPPNREHNVSNKREICGEHVFAAPELALPLLRLGGSLALQNPLRIASS